MPSARVGAHALVAGGQKKRADVNRRVLERGLFATQLFASPSALGASAAGAASTAVFLVAFLRGLAAFLPFDFL